MTGPHDSPQPGIYPQSRFQPPPGALELLLVRHGESEAYVEGKPVPLVGGQADPPLSPEGRDQAERVCARLAGMTIDAIYVTPLQRTGQTATPLASRLGVAPVVEQDLREVYLGEWEGGRYRKMVADRHPTARQMFTQERWEIVPGAETSASLATRVHAAIERLAARHPGQRVAAFAHGGVIAQALALASGSRPFAFLTVDNASISQIVVTGDRWIVRGFNDTAHLEDHR